MPPKGFRWSVQSILGNGLSHSRQQTGASLPGSRLRRRNFVVQPGVRFPGEVERPYFRNGSGGWALWLCGGIGRRMEMKDATSNSSAVLCFSIALGASERGCGFESHRSQ